VVAAAFPDEFHVGTLPQLLEALPRLEPGVKLANVMGPLLERLAGCAPVLRVPFCFCLPPRFARVACAFAARRWAAARPRQALPRPSQHARLFVFSNRPSNAPPP
jgi:hypothetical protein